VVVSTSTSPAWVSLTFESEYYSSGPFFSSISIHLPVLFFLFCHLKCRDLSWLPNLPTLPTQTLNHHLQQNLPDGPSSLDHPLNPLQKRRIIRSLLLHNQIRSIPPIRLSNWSLPPFRYLHLHPRQHPHPPPLMGKPNLTPRLQIWVRKGRSQPLHNLKLSKPQLSRQRHPPRP
jgi:hypothetical protein